MGGGASKSNAAATATPAAATPAPAKSGDTKAEGAAAPRKQRVRRGSVSAECGTTGGAWKKVVVPKSGETKASIRDAVKGNFLFEGLTEEQLADIVDVMTEKAVVPGDKIITEGETGDFFYIIGHGTYDVFVKAAGTEPVLHYEGSGSFGELALMYNCPRAATVMATSDGMLYSVDRQSFRHIILTANQVKATRLENTLKKIDMLENLDISERAQLADNLGIQSFKAGEEIIHQGSSVYATMKFFLMESGTVQAYFEPSVTEPDGKRMLAGQPMGPGGYFGEKALIEKKPRAATVIAVSDVTVAYMDVACFERLMGPCKDVMQRNIGTYISRDTARRNSMQTSGSTPLLVAADAKEAEATEKTEEGESKVDTSKVEEAAESKVDDSAESKVQETEVKDQETKEV